MRSNSDGGTLNERRSMSAAQQVPMEKHGSGVLVASQGGRHIFAAKSYLECQEREGCRTGRDTKERHGSTVAARVSGALVRAGPAVGLWGTSPGKAMEQQVANGPEPGIGVGLSGSRQGTQMRLGSEPRIVAETWEISN
jgi:hypothetical protein